MSRISASLTTPTVSSTNTTTTISVSGSLKYASGSWGWTCNGYISINSLKKSFSNVRGTTSGATFYTTSHSRTYDRGKSDKTVTIAMYGYCTDSTSDTAKATRTVTVPALPSYTVTCDGVSYTKWYDEELTLPTPTQAGYIFDGWSDGVTNYGTSYTNNSAATLTAVWTPDHVPPRIADYNCQRVSNSTTATFNIGYVRGESNSAQISIQYKLKSESSWHTLSTASITQASGTYTYTGGNFNVNNTYDIRYTLTDEYFSLETLDLLSKEAYIWKALPNSLDIGVPLTVQGQTPLYSLPYCSCRGTGTMSSTTSAGKLTLTSAGLIARSSASDFEISSGGIKCVKAGIIMVSGSIYYTSGSSGRYGVYIRLNDAAELTSTYMTLGASGAVSCAPLIMPVAAGDIIHLYERASISSTVEKSNVSTHLDIVYLATS